MCNMGHVYTHLMRVGQDLSLPDHVLLQHFLLGLDKDSAPLLQHFWLGLDKNPSLHP